MMHWLQRCSVRPSYSKADFTLNLKNYLSCRAISQSLREQIFWCKLGVTPQSVNTTVCMCNLYVLEGDGGVWLTYPQPLVHTFPMELMAAGQDSQQLAGLKITHAHHTPVAQRTNTWM